MNKLQNKDFLHKIVNLLAEARQQVVRSVNKTMVLTYFEIGRMIVEEEQEGKECAGYEKSLLKGVSKELTKQFERGFSIRNLEQMRKFYRAYTISQTPSAKLEKENPTTVFWNSNKQQNFFAKFNLNRSHYLTLIRIENKDERSFYKTILPTSAEFKSIIKE